MADDASDSPGARLRAKYGDTMGPTVEQLSFARAALSIASGVEALGSDWRCWVDVWNKSEKTATINVRVGDHVGAWAFGARGCDIDALVNMLRDIHREGGGHIESALRALRTAFAKWTPEYEYAQALYQYDRAPLPLPG